MRLIEAEAKRLEDWFGGEKVSPAYKSPLVTGDEPVSCSAMSLILGPGVDSRAIVSSSLQVTSSGRHSRGDNP